MTDEIMYGSINIIAAIFGVFIIHIYIDGFFSPNNSRMRGARFIGYMVFGITLSAISVFLPKMILLMSTTFLFILLITLLFYESDPLTRCFSAFSFCILALIAESICAFVIAMLTEQGVAAALEPVGAQRIIGMVSSRLLLIFIVKLALIIIRRQRGVFSNKMLHIIPLLLCQAVSLVIVGDITLHSYNSSGVVPVSTLLAIIGIFYMNVIIFWYFDRIVTMYRLRHEKEIAEIKLEDQLKYYDLVKTRGEQLASLRHEVARHVSVMKRMLDIGQRDESVKYLASLTAMADRYLNTVDTSDPAISAILNDFIERAAIHGIKPKLTLFMSDDISIDRIDLTVILGNTFDNAIEALDQLESEKEKWLDITIRQSDAYLYYEIRNPYNPNQKRNGKRNREAYGLRNVKETVRKYGGIIDSTPEHDVFKIIITIPLTPI